MRWDGGVLFSLGGVCPGEVPQRRALMLFVELFFRQSKTRDYEQKKKADMLEDAEFESRLGPKSEPLNFALHFASFLPLFICLGIRVVKASCMPDHRSSGLAAPRLAT